MPLHRYGFSFNHLNELNKHLKDYRPEHYSASRCVFAYRLASSYAKEVNYYSSSRCILTRYVRLKYAYYRDTLGVDAHVFCLFIFSYLFCVDSMRHLAGSTCLINSDVFNDRGVIRSFSMQLQMELCGEFN